MAKKMYKKPQTEKIPMVSESETLSFLGGGSNPIAPPSEPGPAQMDRQV